MEVIVWPATALIFGLIVFFVLRRSVEGFLERADRISREGIFAETGANDQRLRNLVRLEIDEQARLLRTSTFQFIYLVMTAEQQKALLQISASGGKINCRELLAWYEKNKIEHESVDLSDLLSFLRDVNLLVENRGNVIMTEIGHEYVTFLQNDRRLHQVKL